MRTSWRTDDNSVDEGFAFYLPPSGVIKELDLHLRNGKLLEYLDPGGTVRWQGPSLLWRGSGPGVASRGYLVSKLAGAGLEPVWVLAGEKNVYAGNDVGCQWEDLAAACITPPPSPRRLAS